jgi:ATP-dependent helicase/nuclease subunit A
MALARQLFAVAIETPGGLKVQTIHAFCERLLQRFPLEAGVPPGFTILDDEMTATLRREAIDDVLARATSGRDPALGAALDVAIAHAGEESFDERLAEALSHRELLEALVVRMPSDEDADGDGDGEHDGDGVAASFAALEAHLRATFGVRANSTRARIEAELAAVLKPADLVRIRDVLATGSKRDQGQADLAAAVLAATTPARTCEAMAAFFLTQSGTPRSALITKKLQEAHSDIDALLARAQSDCVRLVDERLGLAVVAATVALLRLADAVSTRYRAAKARRASLDFDDLIVATAALLSSRDAASWVLYKLDGGLDHVLIDESQDTSPLQWQVIRAIVAEFFAGEGTHDGQRTVFAVGDEKQSIYSFQGAAPEMFAASGGHFAAQSRAAGLPFREIALLLSFRTVVPVLAAVDRVFADAAATPGLSVSADPIRHLSSRAGHAGLVEIWPPEVAETDEGTDAWSPLEDRPQPSPVTRLAERIANTIQDWLATGERLISEDRPIRPSDVLILVARRRPFAAPMIAALKTREIPVAGADRIRITEQIAVEDLVALGDFVLLPDDDLALAVVLKSPLFGFDDEDLIRIGAGRRGTLWRALLADGDRDTRSTAAVAQLKRWRGRADLAPPYEFFASLLDADNGRYRKLMLARLGPEAADPIDEFLSLALAYDDGATPSLVGFLDWLRQSNREVKRDMDHGRNEVRIMTVHGAKGLEAPIVFLPDTCSNPIGRGVTGLIRIDGTAHDRPLPEMRVWPIKSSRRLAPIATGSRTATGLLKEEANRLLYVAMTRARDRLYVAGFETARGRAKGCWYDTITAGLAGTVATVDEAGRKVQRSVTPQTAEPKRRDAEDAAAHHDVALPDWALRPAPRERQLSIPMAPSQFVPYEIDEEGDPVERPADSPESRRDAATKEPAEPAPRVLSSDNRFLRGTLTHALLEHLPGFPPTSWPEAAKAFVARRGRDLTARQRQSIVKETLAVLQNPDFAPLFGAHARAEVPIVTEIANPKKGGPPLVINGQIDRLARVDDAIFIVDYKTNRPPPGELGGVADAYLFQLAAYRLGVARIFPGLSVRAAILWTETPRMMEIPQAILDDYQSRIWELESLSLDAA